MNHLYDLGLKMQESTLEAHLPNGSKIMLFGADMENAAKRLLGDSYSCVVIDEAQAFGSHLEDLIYDILEPATLDYDGPICLIGTPGPVCAGLFWQVTTGQKPGWSNHHWTLYDNPHLPHATEWVNDLLERRGWDWETPRVRREYKGEWVEDPDARVYRYTDALNVCREDEIPSGLQYVMGVDLGFNDKFAICVIGYSHHHGKAWVVHAESIGGKIPSYWATRIKSVLGIWPAHSIVVDTGGLGKAITEEFRQRYQIPCEPAEKTQKAAYQELLNGDFEEGTILVPDRFVDLRDQLKVLVKDDKGQDHPEMPNDLCDSMLYSYRQSRHFWRKIDERNPMPGSAEWYDREERDMERQIVRRHRPKPEQKW